MTLVGQMNQSHWSYTNLHQLRIWQ